MYTTIDIDFDVYKEITIRRQTPETTENDVLREQFGLDPVRPAKSQPQRLSPLSGTPWVCKGVTFLHGTEFRATYKGQMYSAKVENGALVYNGQRYTSPSPAAITITGNSVNGWKFWESKMPGSSSWVLIYSLKK